MIIYLLNSRERERRREERKNFVNHWFAIRCEAIRFTGDIWYTSQTEPMHWQCKKRRRRRSDVMADCYLSENLPLSGKALVGWLKTEPPTTACHPPRQVWYPTYWATLRWGWEWSAFKWICLLLLIGLNTFHFWQLSFFRSLVSYPTDRLITMHRADSMVSSFGFQAILWKPTSSARQSQSGSMMIGRLRESI